MPTFEATVRVTHIESWSVEAKDAEEAREKINGGHDDVEADETGGEVIDWEIKTLKKLD